MNRKTPLSSANVLPSAWVKPICLHVGIGATLNDKPWPKGVRFERFPVIRDTPDEALMVVVANAAFVIASLEYPDDTDRATARTRELTDRVKIG